MAKLEVTNIRTLDGTHIDSTNPCDLNIPMDWLLDLNWYRFYGNSPNNLEYRITSSKVLEVNLDGVWTPLSWTNTTRAGPCRLTIDFSRPGKGWVEAYLHMTNEVLHETTINPFYSAAGGWTTIRFAENNAIFRKTFDRHMQRKAKEFPVIPPMSDERRAGLLEKARIGFEEMWDFFYNQRRTEYRRQVEKWAERMMNLGYGSDPREDPKYLTEREEPKPVERAKVDWFMHEGAAFIGNKKEIDAEHESAAGGCECYACDHSKSSYEDNDNCCCDQCCQNIGHWNTNRRDPNHCDFCHEFAAHLAEHAPDQLRKFDED